MKKTIDSSQEILDETKKQQKKASADARHRSKKLKETEIASQISKIEQK